MTKLLVNAKVEGFRVQYGENVIATKLEGGPSRYRQDKIGNSDIVQAQWILSAQAFAYFMAFYRTEIKFGSLPFEIDLKAVDSDSLQTYTAHIVPGSLQLSGLIGQVHTVNAQLEILPLAIDEEADQDLIDGGPGDE
jgi:hypothetical protein